jgi:hypothetical protein
MGNPAWMLRKMFMAGDTAESPKAQDYPASSGSTDIFSDKLSSWILNLGFLFAPIIATICFIFFGTLFRYVSFDNE